MSTEVKVEITGPHGKVRVTVENKTAAGAWYESSDVTILPGQLGDFVKKLVYGTQRLIIEELPFE